MVLLCCEGAFLLLGIIILVAGSFRFYGKYIYGSRRAIMGTALLIQAPLAILLGSAALGGTPPGAIEGADVIDARNRIIAAGVEWGIVLTAGGISLCAFLKAPTNPPDTFMESKGDT